MEQILIYLMGQISICRSPMRNSLGFTEFPQQFGLQGVLINSGAGRNIPTPTPSFTY